MTVKYSTKMTVKYSTKMTVDKVSGPSNPTKVPVG
jgi:hypothetical protein